MKLIRIIALASTLVACAEQASSPQGNEDDGSGGAVAAPDGNTEESMPAESCPSDELDSGESLTANVLGTSPPQPEPVGGNVPRSGTFRLTKWDHHGEESPASISSSGSYRFRDGVVEIATDKLRGTFEWTQHNNETIFITGTCPDALAGETFAIQYSSTADTWSIFGDEGGVWTYTLEQ